MVHNLIFLYYILNYEKSQSLQKLKQKMIDLLILLVLYSNFTYGYKRKKNYLLLHPDHMKWFTVSRARAASQSSSSGSSGPSPNEFYNCRKEMKKPNAVLWSLQQLLLLLLRLPDFILLYH